ncbi:MAG: hypothetical protein M9894_06000 [Planctomycetes bacterium]|nr:hypothetical protein [Planctomycetota bacterium]
MGDGVGELLGECARADCPHGRLLVGDAAAAAAAAELEGGDLAHAAQHLAAAIAGEPLRPEWRALLDRLLAAAPAPTALFPLHPEPPFVGHLVCHAQALARQAEPGRGLCLLVKAARQRPGVPYLAWASDWFDSPAALRRPKATEVARALEEWLRPHLLVRRPALTAAERRDIERFRPALEQLLKVHAAYPPLQGLGSCFLRLAGRGALAVTVALRAFKASPRFIPAVTLALAQHVNGDLAGAVRTYKRALELDPSATGIEVELGDLHLELRQPGGAVAWYRRAVERGTPELAVEPGLLVARYLREHDPACLDALRALGAGDPPHERARDWLAWLGHPLPPLRPWIDQLPPPGDVTLELLWKVVLASDDPPTGVLVRTALSEVEAPSARLAFDLVADQLGLQSSFRVLRVQDPDPRLPACEVEHLLWTYEGTHARPAVEPPDEAVRAEVAGLAVTPYSLAGWAAAGKALGARLGPAAIPDLLATMVHPPPLPEALDVTADRWLLRVQQAAALTIAGAEEGWAGTRRRAALHALVHGPMDWTVQAALVAVCDLAAESPEVREEARRWLDGLLARVPRPGYCCWLRAAVVLAQRLPGASEEVRRRCAELEAALASA